MIVRDEEAVIGRCLSCAAAFADELVVVDTGSIDRTKEIAASFTPHLYEFPWIDDFAAARNFSFSKGTGDFLMWLDADDVVTPEDAASLCHLKETLDSTVDVVMLPYQTAFDETGKATFSYYRERILRRAADPVWIGAIHEVIPPRGNVIYRDIPVRHEKISPGDPDRNLRIFEKLRAEGVPLDARQKYYYARELLFHARYREAIAGLETFLADPNGWVENRLGACLDLAACWEALGKPEQGIRALLRALEWAPPRGELACALGNCFCAKEDWRTAVFWYETALHLKPPSESGAFVQTDCYGFLPYLQLCVCFDKLGEQIKAAEYNELAGEIHPAHPSVVWNRNYFEGLGIFPLQKEV